MRGGRLKTSDASDDDIYLRSGDAPHENLRDFRDAQKRSFWRTNKAAALFRALLTSVRKAPG